MIYPIISNTPFLYSNRYFSWVIDHCLGKSHMVQILNGNWANVEHFRIIDSTNVYLNVFSGRLKRGTYIQMLDRFFPSGDSEKV